jgi:hypothetical protein
MRKACNISKTTFKNVLEEVIFSVCVNLDVYLKQERVCSTKTPFCVTN